MRKLWQSSDKCNSAKRKKCCGWICDNQPCPVGRSQKQLNEIFDADGAFDIGTRCNIALSQPILPVDPMTGKPEWGMRSMQDDPTSDSWGEQNVFDVYTKSEGTALDGTKYKDW